VAPATLIPEEEGIGMPLGRTMKGLPFQPGKNIQRDWAHWILMATDSPMMRNLPLVHIPEIPIGNREARKNALHLGTGRAHTRRMGAGY